MTTQDQLRDQIVRGEINEISDRAAMGLPEAYVSPRGEDLSRTLLQVRDASPGELAALVESETEPLDTRLAAGLMLGHLGDPRCPDLDPVMVDVPAGFATLGLDPSRVDDLYERYRRYGVKRNWIEKECPRHQLPIQAFRIGRYPVTNSQYLAFLKDGGAEHLPAHWGFGRFPPGAGNQPVYTVTPEDADAYVAWLADRTGRPFRLPTEAEWEYAAAGPEGHDFPWGDEFREDSANTMELALLMTTPAGMFPRGASPFGVLDMAGNVEEYVSSRYEPYPGWQVVEDDLFKLLGFYRIARGGAFNRFQDLTRCQRRHGPYPKSLYAIGFRIAEDLAGATDPA
jgi:formylglycine-generating enzyme required for sulfatase activity